MRKTILMCILSATICGCASTSKNPNESDEDITVIVEAEAENTYSEPAPNVDKLVTGMLTDMFNNSLFEDEDWLENHCTQKCLKYLRSEYEYDCEDGRCYAVWKFRTNAQDGSGVTKIISVEKVKDEYYDYSFLDMGFKGINRVKVIFTDNKIYIDEIINIEDNSPDDSI